MDWAGLMRAGLHGLGLTPDQFWRLTPWELRVMLGLGAEAAPMGRARFEALAAKYPDRRGDG
ncbi:MAG: rcc01693 family protein [Gemmobacter sp.]